jgi:hypothetical protein
MKPGAVDLARYRRGLELLDEAAARGARPINEAELEALNDEGGRVKPTSVRLTEDQAVTLEQLAPILTERRPDLAALGGGELSPYAVLRVAIHLGIAQLRTECGLPDDERERAAWWEAVTWARGAGMTPDELEGIARHWPQGKPPGLRGGA